MKAMLLDGVVNLQKNKKPLRFGECPTPHAGAGEIRIKVFACGVCHTCGHLRSWRDAHLHRNSLSRVVGRDFVCCVCVKGIRRRALLPHRGSTRPHTARHPQLSLTYPSTRSSSQSTAPRPSRHPSMSLQSPGSLFRTARLSRWSHRRPDRRRRPRRS